MSEHTNAPDGKASPPVASYQSTFRAGDTVEITAEVMTKGKLAQVVEWSFDKIEVSFGAQWSGYYYPHEIRKIDNERI